MPAPFPGHGPLRSFRRPPRARGESDEEFVGPFSSWADVKRDYGATGDGKADDTAAIQKVLDELREHKKFCVLYFPAGRDEHEALREHPQPC